MASDNARRFEVRLRKLGLFMLVCSMSCLLFAAFLFGVVVGGDLENYPEKISRRAPARFLQWVGLLEAEKPRPLAVVIKSEKTVPRREVETSEVMASNVIPQPAPSAKKDEPGVDNSPALPEKVREPSAAAVPEKGKHEPAPSVLLKDKEAAGEKFLVQVTSCKNRKIAEDVVKDIGKIGYKTHIATVDLKEKGMWYRVVLPDLGSREKAQEAAKKIDRILKGNKSIVRVQKR